MKVNNTEQVAKFSRVKIIGIVFFLYIVGTFGVSMLGWNEKLQQIPLYCFFAICLLFAKGNTLIKNFLLWYTPFALFCFISSLYAPNMNVATNMFASLGMAFLFGLSITIFLSYEGALSYIKCSYIVVALFVGIRLILSFEQENWWSRLGESFNMNGNLVALSFLIPFCFSVNDFLEKKQRIFSALAILVFSYVIMLTGSKKAIFAAVLFVFLFSIIKAGKITKRMRAIIIVGILAVILYNLVMKVEILYNVLGHRIKSMIRTFTSEDITSSNSSTGLRGGMIVFGLKEFLRSPVWGQGLNAFRVLYGDETEFYTYAHNNYVEVLVNTGIIGFCMYYSLIGRTVRYFVKLKKQAKENAFLIALTAVLLFYDIAMVSYYDTRIIMLSMIAFAGAHSAYHKKIEENDDKAIV